MDGQKMVGELVEMHNTLVQLHLRYLEAASDEKLLQDKIESIQAKIATRERKCEEGRFFFFLFFYLSISLSLCFLSPLLCSAFSGR